MSLAIKQLWDHIVKKIDVKEPTPHESAKCQNIKMDWFFYECNRCQKITPENKEFCEKICQKKADQFSACAIRHEWFKILNDPSIS